MVVWLFAGGGESEVQGLVPFLKKCFSPEIYFDRKTPVKRKPGAKPGKKPVVSHGKTGKSLVQEVKLRLLMALKNETPCDLILILDDLDWTPFSKARHTPEMMTLLDPQAVCTKCPIFRDWWNRFTTLTNC